MSQITETPKKHKKHKKDRDKARGDKSDGMGTPSYSGTPSSNRLKLILKVGGSSTPEHSDSPGPSSSLSVLNIYDEDSQQSTMSMSQMSHSKKSKKKDKKSKKEKKHKHRHKEKKKRDKEDIVDCSSMSMSMDIDSVESASSGILAATSKVLGEIGLGSPSSQSPFDIDIGNTLNINTTSTMASAVEREQIVEAKPVFKQKPGEKQPFQKLLDHLLRALQKKDPQLFFAWPVTDKIAPGYSTIIKEPMDFSTMKSKIDEGSYNTLPEFTVDFHLMCDNAMVYNGQETIYYKAAKKLLQSGMKILDPDRIRSLLPLIPSIRVLTEESLGFCLLPDQLQLDNADHSQSEEDNQENICLDPTKSIHYVPPHPNDPPDLSGAFSDDLTTEEVLHQARIAAREAAHRLTTKKPNSKMGFLRQRPDGSTSLAILTPCSGVQPGTQEQPVTLNVLAGKLTQGSTQVHGSKDEKKNIQRTVKPLYYGAFSSFAPSLDSTFSNLTSTESDMVRNTYGDETAIQYAESMIEFAKGCDYAMYMVDELLDTVTKGEHKRTVNVVEERKRVEDEEARMRKEQEEFQTQLDMEWENATKVAVPTPNVNFDSLRSLSELGIDTSFVEEFKDTVNPVVTVKLEETANLITDLQKAQNDRLRLPSQPNPPFVPAPSDEEMRIADRITENLTELAKSVTPGSIVSEEALRKAMGVDIDSAAFTYGIPQPQPVPLPHPMSMEVVETQDVPMEVHTVKVMDEMIIIPETVTQMQESLLECTNVVSIPSGEPIISSTTNTPPEIMPSDLDQMQ
ncbi:unnamed protein product [Orchesella dallaii]|uniref:Bromo domain-containing protein n=1 Tax=Orchesella dallaii TaxID=48710 RepID=A0ABP1PP38_9HEXA